jgi:hypothetical protein
LRSVPFAFASSASSITHSMSSGSTAAGVAARAISIFGSHGFHSIKTP